MRRKSERVIREAFVDFIWNDPIVIIINITTTTTATTTATSFKYQKLCTTILVK